MLRTLAERLSRNIVLRRRLPHDLGGHFIYVTPESALNFWFPGLERADHGYLMDMVRRFVARDSVAWDVGANVGLFSFAAAAKARTVLAVEPDPWLAALLNRSASAITNVRVLCAAVADSVDLGELNIAHRVLLRRRHQRVLRPPGVQRAGHRGAAADRIRPVQRDDPGPGRPGAHDQIGR